MPQGFQSLSGDVKVYNFTGGKTLPEWLPERKRRALLKKDFDLQKRIELIQDFDMPTASTNIKLSKDSNYVIAAGLYKPRLRCFDLDQLSQKFERYLNAQVVDFEVLTEDYSKLVLLTDDRNVEVHARYGFHYRTRVPRYGRAITYNPASCDLFVVGASPEIFRLNLDQGRFLKPMVTTASSINCCALNPVHGLLAAGTSEGTVECFDPRTKAAVGSLPVAASLEGGKNTEVTSLTFFSDGLTLAAGTANGNVLMYDIRSSTPTVTKEHAYGLPIKGIREHRMSGNVVSCDSKVVKIWNKTSGEAVTNIEVGHDINDICIVPDSGLFFLANESSKIMSFFVPLLGPAPKWCSFLDGLTEELDAEAPAVYDDYKFVTRTELAELGLEHLIGTNLLRAYMHGFFMDIKLYRKVKDVAQPFAYDEFRKKQVQKKIEEETADRLHLPKRKLPAVNAQLAKRLIEKQAAEDPEAAAAAAADVSNPLGDSRFADMFKNPDFQIDTESHEYKLLHPVAARSSRPDLLEFTTAVEQDESEAEGRGSDDEGSDSDEDMPPIKRKPVEKAPARAEAKAAPRKQLQVMSAHDARELKTAVSAADLARPLAERLAERDDEPTIARSGGAMSFSFKYKRDKPADSRPSTGPRPRTQDRRGVGELRLPKESKNKFWRGKLVKK
eukprot:m.82191 g.82191  ORF g.82191 m.82191 type:complete len:669 (+) comp13394_c4_seq1:575-2581(+)